MVTLSRRFAAAFLFLVAIPSLGVSVMLSRLYLQALLETATEQAQVTAEQVAGHLRDDVDNAALLAAALVHDEELGELAGALSSAPAGRPRYEASRRLDEKLVGVFRYTKQVGAIVVFLQDGSSYAYSNYPNLRDVRSLDRAVYRAAAANPGVVSLLDTLDGVGQNVGARNMITLAVCPEHRGEGAVDAIVVTFRVPYLDDLVTRWSADDRSALVLFGRSSRPLLSTLSKAGSDAELASLAPKTPDAPSRLAETKVAGRTWLTASYPVSSTGWSLLLLDDRAALARRVTAYQWYLYPALAVLAVVFLLYVEYFFAGIALPIRRIVGHMGAVGKGDLAVRAEPTKLTELAVLSQGFNSMVQRIDALGQERERIQRERLALELDALRYQINPHFVANTLNAIRFMALASSSDAIAQMTRDLMRLLADSYADGDKLIPLQRELDNVKAYVGIMQLRYGERFAVQFDCEPGIEQLLTLRLILQPIVENAILHGFPDLASSPGARTGRGTITITARTQPGEARVPASLPETWARPLPGRVVVMEVRDDGVGIEPDKVAQLLVETPRSGGGLHRIGIANVHRRVVLNFGAACGLEITSRPGEFTVIRFVLPALERIAEETVVHA